MSSSNSLKSKKKSKEDKKKIHTSNLDNNLNAKGSPEKESKQYAGISSDIIKNYAGQAMFEKPLLDDVCNTLSEDINYKLRYIIHDALIKARLCGREIISSRDIEESFSNLSIEKVYGAPTNPTWVPLTHLPDPGNDQTFYYLDDSLVNLVELAEEVTYVQYGKVEIKNGWFPDPDSNNLPLKNYFTVACKTVIGAEVDLRYMVLKDISENPQAATIAEWFYHFAYFLLMKNITYDDSLTLRALELLETLENSPLTNASVSPKQLKLLIRLLLQRLRLTTPSPDVIKKICFTLSILCLRPSLKEITISKVKEKFDTFINSALLQFLSIIYYLGVDAIREIFLPQLSYFSPFYDKISLENNNEITYMMLAIYGIICKTEQDNTYIHNWFDYIIPNELVIYWQPLKYEIKGTRKLEINFVVVKSQLIKTRKKVDCKILEKQRSAVVEAAFKIYKSKLLNNNFESITKPTHKSELVDNEMKLQSNDMEWQSQSPNKSKKLGDVFVNKNSIKPPEDSNYKNDKMEINKLIKSNRPTTLEEAFDLPYYKTKLGKKVYDFRMLSRNYKKQTHFIVGKTSLLLSVLKSKKRNKCYDHSLYSYCL